jgi:hypothetical protein
MHFFDKFMQKTDWKNAADGMWFIQDYVDFMGMLQQLAIDKDENKSCTSNTDHQLPGYSDGKTLPDRFEVRSFRSPRPCLSPFQRAVVIFRLQRCGGVQV